MRASGFQAVRLELLLSPNLGADGAKRLPDVRGESTPELPDGAAPATEEQQMIRRVRLSTIASHTNTSHSYRLRARRAKTCGAIL